MKVGLLAVRQITRPLARQFVVHAKRGRMRTCCIVLGRCSLGMTSAIKLLSRQEKLEEAQKQAQLMKEAKPHQDPVIDVLSSSLPNASTPTSFANQIQQEWARGTRAVSQRSRSLLQSLTYGPVPKEKYDPSLFLDHGSPKEAPKLHIFYPYTSRWKLFRQEFASTYPEQQLIDAGADFLLEIVAFTILTALLSYELNIQFKANARKESIINARIDRLERKIARMQEKYDMTVDESVEPYYEEDTIQHIEEVVRFKWIRKLYRFTAAAIQKAADQAAAIPLPTNTSVV